MAHGFWKADPQFSLRLRGHRSGVPVGAKHARARVGRALRGRRGGVFVLAPIICMFASALTQDIVGEKKRKRGTTKAGQNTSPEKLTFCPASSPRFAPAKNPK